MDLTFYNIKGYEVTRKENKPYSITIKDVDDETLKDVCMGTLHEMGYDVKLIRVYHECPVCKSQSRLILETRHSVYENDDKVYYIECCNKEECGLRTQDFWTKLDAEIAWEDICSHVKE
jgi:hypothetical protein